MELRLHAWVMALPSFRSFIERWNMHNRPSLNPFKVWIVLAILMQPGASA